MKGKNKLITAILGLSLIFIFTSLSGCGGGSYSGGSSGGTSGHLISISGTVSGGSNPLSNLNVSAYDANGETELAEGTTNSNGQYSINLNLPSDGGLIYLVASNPASPNQTLSAIAGTTSTLIYENMATININEVTTVAAVNSLTNFGFTVNPSGVVTSGASSTGANEVADRYGSIINSLGELSDPTLEPAIVYISDAISNCVNASSMTAAECTVSLDGNSSASSTIQAIEYIQENDLNSTVINDVISSAQNASSSYAPVSLTGFTAPSSLNTDAALNSISITPSSPSVTGGNTEQFAATGTFSDGTTENITNLVTWNSSETSVAAISDSGLATADLTGSTNITASLGSISSSADTLTVTAAVSSGLTYSSLYSYGGAGDGTELYNQLTYDSSNGNIYGTTGGNGTFETSSLFGFNPSSSSTDVVLFYSFAGGVSDAASPNSMTFDPDNDMLYGTSYSGGGHGAGVVFSFNPGTNAEALAVSFPVNNNSGAPLTYDPGNQMFYGTTTQGGIGWGSIFEFDPSSGLETLSYSFENASGDGAFPQTAMTYDPANFMFYGTTNESGSNGTSFGGYGMIYKFNPGNNAETPVYSFTDSSGDGKNPGNGAPLTYDPSNGMFYGTTTGGGADGYGIIFEFNPGTNAETPVYSFTGSSGDGASPNGMTYDSANGLFYGITYSGGTSGKGTIFEFNPGTNAETPLYSFTGVSTDGSYPYAPPVYDPVTNAFYGTTTTGGLYGYGTIYDFVAP